MGFSQIKRRRADQVADILDHQDVGGVEIKMFDPVADHVGVEMAAGTGVDLVDGGSGRGNAVGIVAGLLIPFEDGKADLVFEQRNRLFEQGGFSGAGRADQVQGKDPVGGKVFTVVRCQVVVLGQQVFFNSDRFAGVIMVMVVMVVSMAMAMAVAGAAAFDTHGYSTSISVILSSVPPVV